MIANKLEKMDFGDMYEALFVNPEFTKKSREIAGGKLSKADLIKKLDLIEEKNLWMQFFDTKYNFMPKYFLTIKDYRNAVMHAHNFDYDYFKNVGAILDAANDLLDEIYDDFIADGELNDIEHLGNMIDKMQAVLQANLFNNPTFAESLINIMMFQSKFKSVLNTDEIEKINKELSRRPNGEDDNE